jgi:hypothetical protein
LPLTRPVSAAALSRALAFTAALAASCSTVSPSCSRVCSISSCSSWTSSGGLVSASSVAAGSQQGAVG